MADNFFFNETKMKAFNSLTKREFLKLFPTVTEKQYYKTCLMVARHESNKNKMIQKHGN